MYSGASNTAYYYCLRSDLYHGCRADSRFGPCQWETALLCNDASHWLGASLESALWLQHWRLPCSLQAVFTCEISSFYIYRYLMVSRMVFCYIIYTLLLIAGCGYQLSYHVSVCSHSHNKSYLKQDLRGQSMSWEVACTCLGVWQCW